MRFRMCSFQPEIRGNVLPCDTLSVHAFTSNGEQNSEVPP